ncbi:MAG: hypothetical protein GY778_30325 [bacterium]|nr:hypothetical protein [bacterium]
MAPSLIQIPNVALVAVAVVLLMVGRYVQLALRVRHAAGASQVSLDALAATVRDLRAYSADHQGSLPPTPDSVGPPATGFRYRPVPRWGIDDRLVLLYDSTARHAIMAFPVVRPGFAVYLMGGKTLVVTAEQLDQLLRGDDGLRAQLGLKPVAETKFDGTASHGRQRTPGSNLPLL